MSLPGRNDLSVTAFHAALIILLAASIYLPFLGDSGWEGNEPLRVVVAHEMLKSGNYMQPVYHGSPYFLKPPLINWLIAASAKLTGSMDEWSSRLPSVLLMFLLSISVYFSTSAWLKRHGRLFAALATLSTAGLIFRGRAAEVDTLFIFMVVIILLLWLNGYVRKWPPVLLWSSSLFLLGISFLTKGPQAPAYFYSTVFVFLFFRKQTSFFFSRAHLFGLLIFAGVLLLYLASVLKSISLNEYIDLWIRQITQRGSTGKNSFLGHLFTYPATIFLNFMPWIVFSLPALFFKEIRAGLTRLLSNDLVAFSAVMIAVNFPVYWLLPGGRDRYFLPAGPFMVFINAALYESYIEAAETMPRVRTFFEQTLKSLSWTALISVAAISLAAVYRGITLPMLFGLIAAGLVVLAFSVLYRMREVSLQHYPVLIAFLVGLIFPLAFGMYARYDAMKENNPKKIAAEINGLLPDDIAVVYELGYKRFQSITCYLKKEVIMLDGFDKLLSMPASKIYFIFDSGFLNDSGDNPRKTALPESGWEPVYSRHLRASKGKLIVGRLTEAGQ